MRKWKSSEEDRFTGEGSSRARGAELTFHNGLPRGAGQEFNLPVDQDASCNKDASSAAMAGTPTMQPIEDVFYEGATAASPHLMPEMLMQYSENSISDEATLQRVHAHLAHCAACQGFLDCMALPDLSDDRLRQDIRADLEQEHQEGVVLLQAETSASPLVPAWDVLRSDLQPILHHIESLGTLDTIQVAWAPDQSLSAAHPRHMLKEIHQQPDVLRGLVALFTNQGHSKVRMGDLGVSNKALRDTPRILIQACGSSLHAGLFGRLLIEHLAGIPVDVAVASEFSYHTKATLPPGTLVLAISQSGENADTVAGARAAREQGLKVIAIVNEPDSTLARESDGFVLVGAGPELGITSTKAYTAQLGVLHLLGLHLAALRGQITPTNVALRLSRLCTAADLLARYLEDDALIQQIAGDMATDSGAIFLGSVLGYPSAREGALKFVEVAAVHAEGQPAGELQMNLLDKQRIPVIAIATSRTTNTETYARVLRDVRMLRDRQIKVIAIADRDDREIYRLTEHVIPVPTVAPLTATFAPLITAVPLQLLAYYLGLQRGCIIDQPLWILQDMVRRQLISDAPVYQRTPQSQTTCERVLAEGSLLVQHRSPSRRLRRIQVTLSRKEFDRCPDGWRVLLRLDKGERIEVPLTDAPAETWMATVKKLDSVHSDASSDVPVELLLQSCGR